MRSVGVRELKDSLSSTLALVAAGERVIVTSHGKPVAELVPPLVDRAEAHYHSLVASGAITPAAEPHGEPPTPAPLIGTKTATDYILEERASDRF